MRAFALIRVGARAVRGLGNGYNFTARRMMKDEPRGRVLERTAQYVAMFQDYLNTGEVDQAEVCRTYWGRTPNPNPYPKFNLSRNPNTVAFI